MDTKLINSQKEYDKEHNKFIKELRNLKKKKKFGELLLLIDNADTKGLYPKASILIWKAQISKAFQGKL